MKVRQAVFYRDSRGREPAKDWLESLRDYYGKARIYVRVQRAESGNFGDHRSVGDGVFELRISSGPGYRVYYSLDENDTILLLLVAGDKSSQPRDIKKAKEYWQEHKNG